ncbi:MAG: response regulator, partial [Alphaproteobacteria bacterium]|nr:response regulator [Alphaproteobacteria bacterium]
LHDVTERNDREAERRRAEEALRKSEEQLRQSQKMEAVGQLTGGVAHDFNNLLAAIVPSLEIARDHIDNEVALKYVSHAAHAAARGAKLTHQLLNFAHKQDLVTRPVDVNQMIGALSEMLPRTIGPTIEIKTVLAPALWLAMSDANQLELAVLNLSINARDAMSMGGTLTIASRNLEAGDRTMPPDLERGDYVVIAVSDTGIGMTNETRLRAFEPFFTTKARDRGTGLGLSMVYGLARQSGGTVTIDSAVGKGTTVRLYLPRARLGTQAIDQAGGRHVIEAGPPSRILVVDDDDAVRDVVAMLLRGFGHDIVEADSGQSALDVLALDPRFDLMVVDLAMPNMHGAVFATKARHVLPDVPILFISGYTDAHWLRDVPADRLLRKPFSRIELANKLRQLLAARSGTTPTPASRTDATSRR